MEKFHRFSERFGIYFVVLCCVIGGGLRIAEARQASVSSSMTRTQSGALASRGTKYAIVYTGQTSNFGLQSYVETYAETFSTLAEVQSRMNSIGTSCRNGHAVGQDWACDSSAITAGNLVGVYALTPLQAKQVQNGTESQPVTKYEQVPHMEWRVEIAK